MEKDHDQLRPLIDEILNDGFVMQLGISDAEGPWVASVVYVHDGLDLYWVSIADCRHSRALTRNPNVATTIVADTATDRERALQIQGTAILVDGPLFEFEQKLQAKRRMKIPESPGEILVDGYQWYKLVPSRIGIIYNTRFGYDRKTLEL